MKYFAYGSNMSEKRMLDRNIDFKSREFGVLNDYRLVINKISYKDPNIGYANIVKDIGSVVEGALYDISDNSIDILDKYEGYPKHYKRDKLKIITNDGVVDAVVYVANDKWVSLNDLKVTEEYKKFLMDGKDILSDYYILLLENINT